MQKKLFVIFTVVIAIWAMAGVAHAQAIITNGSGIYLGVNTLGHLNVPDGTGGIFLTPTNSLFIGVYDAAVDGDATSPGCLCEGFGVSGNGISGHAAIDSGGIVNLTLDSFTSTASTATSIVHLTAGPALQVSQQYQPSSNPALMENIVTITNTGAVTINDVRYNRTMDWDVPPTTFDELVTIQGWPATNLLASSDNGFQIPDPLLPMIPFLAACDSANCVHTGPFDHGAAFTFGFGNLLAGDSISFSIFYGAASSEAAALAALAAVGAEVYSFGQPNPAETGLPIGEPATFIFGFKGVGGTPVTVPEPTSLVLLGAGLLGLGIWRKKSK